MLNSFYLRLKKCNSAAYFHQLQKVKFLKKSDIFIKIMWYKKYPGAFNGWETLDLICRSSWWHHKQVSGYREVSVFFIILYGKKMPETLIQFCK